ncbi:hypothetical protein [Pedobacter sp.]|uniref:hypothetical protein n=1 Tax=Pedobacter sp. TaxID=1411316 RepID=UPI003BA8BD29
MAFGERSWVELLPSYLTSENKGRLQQGIEQFYPENRNEISYDNFYRDFGHKYFLQGDIVLDVRMANWNASTASYEKTYIEGLILSNTCDISLENKRDVNPKQCLFAPLINLEEFLADLSSNGLSDDKLEAFQKNVKSQLYSNIFYMPAAKADENDRIALLDKVFWFPIEEMEGLIETIDEERIASLDHYGFYLLNFKLSYHFCRLPEQCDRVA